MSRFFKNIKKEHNDYSADITSYLINEIEDIVAKKVDNIAEKSRHNEEPKLNNNAYRPSYQPRYNKKYSNEVDQQHSSANYDNRITEKKAVTPRIAKYINNYEQDNEFLPFEAEEITPNINNKRQIKSIIKQTLRPALNEWLDENLDDIIDRALQERQNSKTASTRNRYYDDE